MDKARLEKLKAHTSAGETEVLDTLAAAVAATLKAYKEDNTSGKLRDWQAAEDGLEKRVIDLEAKYFGTPDAFANITEAVQFLQGQGYKIKKSKMYADAKKGLLTVQPDRSVLETDALAYAVRAELEKAVDPGKELDGIHADKAGAELSLIQTREKKLQFELEKEMGRYLPKADVRAELALKLGAIEAGVKNLMATSLVDWIEVVDGDAKKSPDLQELMFTDLDRLMNEFCRFDELEIIIRPSV